MERPRTPRLLVFIVSILRPPVLLLVFLVGRIYKALFGWWLGPWMDRKYEKSFIKELQESAPSLFAEHDGKFVPNPQNPSKGSESVTVLAEGILFQFSRWRDEITVKVSPEAKPTDLHELSALIKNSTRRLPSQQPAEYFTLRQFGRILDAHFETIRGEIKDRSA